MPDPTPARPDCVHPDSHAAGASRAHSPTPTPPAGFAPVQYTPDVEVEQAGEAETIEGLRDALLDMSKTMHAHTGHAMRSVHAKTFGVLKATLTVRADLPEFLAQGLFARPATYDAVVRFSTPPAERLDDRVSVPRAMALKVLDVPGERVVGSEDETTQDFLMVNGPVFVAPDAKGFLRNLRLLKATTDKAPTGKRLLSVVLRKTEAALEAVGGESKALKHMGGHPQTHPLGETFFTQVPLRYGEYIAKLSTAPHAHALRALTDQALQDPDDPDALTHAVQQYFETNETAVWVLRAQLCTDLDSMPIEDASVEWSEQDSPYMEVGTLEIARQPALDPSRARAWEDTLSFNPWHALAAHQPLGNVMRARRVAYPASVRFRAAANGCPIHERQAGDGASAPPPSVSGV